VESDYIYRDGSLLAAETPQGTRHFHLDHLGTPRLITASGGSGGDFFTLTPCRVIDTRDQFAPIGALQTRVVQMTGACGIPAEATAVSVNLTAVTPSAQGELTAFPANEPRPTASAISYRPGLTRANNAVLKLGNGALAFFANQPSGSVHLIVDVNAYFVEEGAGSVVAYHVYYPFGEEATAFNQDSERMKFTGHERDLGNPGGAGDDLDYMHARHCSPLTGRFLSVDPIQIGRLGQPQRLNRYSYSLNNPLKYVDPTGRDSLPKLPTSPSEFLDMLSDFMHRHAGANLRMSEEETAKVHRNIDRITKLGVGAAVVVKTFENIFQAAEPDDSGKDIRRQEGGKAEARRQFDAAVDPETVDDKGGGTVVGTDRKTERTLIYRETSTDPNAEATIEEQRETEHGRTRSRKVRFKPPKDQD
jgi:RHS repeat-associated protein